MIPIKIDITETQPHDVAKRRWPRISKEGMRAAGDLWQTRFLQLHFQTFSAAKYGYRPRTQKWKMRKKKIAQSGGAVEKGGNVDLVASGLLEELMTGRKHVTKAFPTRFTVDMFGPSYVSMRPRKANRPNMGAEITATTPAERKQLADVWETVTTKLVNELREERTTKG